RAWRLQPGRLAQGPDEKCGVTGRMPGRLLMTLSFQIESPSVGRGGPRTEIRKDGVYVKREQQSVEQNPESDADLLGGHLLPGCQIGWQRGAGRGRKIAQPEITIADIDDP